MAEQHRYQYDKSVPGHAAKKFKCPQCGHKRYVQFYDFQTNQYLPEHFGKCDREDNCGYVSTPWEWLKANGQGDAENYRIKVTYDEPVKARIITVDKAILNQTLQHYEHNNFITYLLTIFSPETVETLKGLYFIGTAKQNGTIFWQLDNLYRIRTAQKIHYKPDGHRDKTFNPPSQRLFTIDKGYVPCLFGEHLIYDAPKTATFAVVEAEKTAIICSVYFPTWNNRPLVWLACCGMHGFTDEKLSALAGQDVLLCPDFAYSARATWGLLPMRKKLNEQTGRKEISEDGELEPDYVSVKDRLVERGCRVHFFDRYPDINDGSDLADYVVNEPPPELVLMPDLANLTLPSRVETGAGDKNMVKTLDFLKIGQEIQNREENKEKPVISVRQKAEKFIHERYGYGVSSRVYDELMPLVEKHLTTLEHPMVKKLVTMFDLDTSLKF